MKTGVAKPPVKAGGAARKTTTLTTNHYVVKASKPIIMYSVTFTPDMGDSSLRTKVVREAKLPDPWVLVGNNLYTPYKIDEKLLDTTVPGSKIKRSEDVHVLIKFYKEYAPNTEIPVSVLGSVIVKAFRTAGYKSFRRNYFDFSRPVVVENLILVPGLSATIVPSNQGHALVADIAYKVSRRGTVLDEWRDLKCNKALFKAKVEGFVVYTSYNNRFYHVDRVDFNKNPNSTFQLSNGKMISFARYVQEQYRCAVTDMKQPMLVSTTKSNGETNEVFLIPECCKLTGLTDEDRKNFSLMKEVTKRMNPPPNVRASETEKGRALIQKNAPSEYGVRIEPPTKVQALLLDQPRRPAKAEQELRSMKKEGCPIRINKILVLKDCRDDVRSAVGQIEKQMGPFWGRAEIVEQEWRRDTNIRQVLQRERPSFVVSVMGRKDEIKYGELKRICTHELGIGSQAMLSKNVCGGRAGIIIPNIVRQIVCKIGYCPRIIPCPPCTRGAMVVGLDVCHKSKIGKSVVGMCATISSNFARYLSAFSLQDQGKEIVHNLRQFIERALQVYREENSAYPSQVVFLRDGVGDGQLDYVNGIEVPAVRGAMEAKCPGSKLMFVVVKKRINTRLYGPGMSSPAPGTVVDDPAITHPNWYDFFMVSHKTTVGTVTPTHYNVIQKDVDWKAEDLYQFLYNMCFMYTNWDDSISVPAPCHYAHRIAFQYAQSILTRDTRGDLLFVNNTDRFLPQL